MMLNERRVKHMVKLASYESKNGTEDMKVNSYFKNDYISFNVLWSLIWMTIGYVLIVGLISVAYMEQFLDNFTLESAVGIIIGVFGLYVALLFLYGIVSTRFYKRKHIEARHNMKYHKQGLEILEKMYKKEDE